MTERFAGEKLLAPAGRDVELEQRIDALMRQGLAFEEAFFVALSPDTAEVKTEVLQAMRGLSDG